MAGVKLNSSGGGSITLSPPVTASNYTITLPAANGTFATLDTVTNNGVVYVNSSGQPTSGNSLQYDGTSLVLGGQTGAGAKLDVQTASGTASTLRLFQNGVSNFVLSVPASTDALAFLQYGSSELMRLTSTGLGIGTSPSYKLDVASSSGANVIRSYNSGTGAGDSAQYYAVNGAVGVNLYAYSSGGNGAIGTFTNHPFAFLTNSTERMRIDSSGNVGIGSSSPAYKLDVYSATNVEARVYGANASRLFITGSTYNWALSSNYYASGKFVIHNVANNTEDLTIDNSGNVGIGTSTPSRKLTILTSTDTPAQFASSGANAYIQLSGSADVYLGSVAGAYTMTTGGSERARIDSSGNLLVGTTTPNATLTVNTASNQQAGRFFVNAASSLATCVLSLAKYDNNTTTSQVFVQFLINNAGLGSGQINANGAGVAAFGSYSDARLKENITALPSQLNNILALKPSEFDYKDGSGHQIGFIAQEMEEVYPDAIGEGEDGMLMITGWSKTEARLVKAIQDQHAIIQTLSAKVAELEAKVK